MDRLSIITLAAAKAYANKKVEALEQVVRYIGVTTTEITDGSTTNPIMIKGQSVTAVAGDTVFYNGTSYSWNGSAWQEVMNIAEIITAVEELGSKVHDILGDIAPTFDSATTYAVDDVVLYEDDLYIFTAEHTGAWDSADVDVTSLANIIEDIRTELSDKQDALPLTFSGNDITTNGSLFAGNEIIDGQGNTLSVLAEALTKTASGNPIVITDCAGGKARSLKTTIEPIQDLHGYDHPWAGGAGKNKLPLTPSVIIAQNSTWTWNGNIGTANGGTAEIVSDGDGNYIGIKLNGTFSAGINLRLTETKNLGYGGMTLSGKTSSISLFVYDDNEGAVYDTGSGVTVPNTYTQYRFVIAIAATTYNNEIIQPMVRASGDATFAPYSNICPISGRTEARVDTENEDSSESAYAVIQLGQTVYGADINWDMGVMTITDAIADMGDLAWTYNSSSQVFNSSVLPGATTENVYTDAISSAYKEHQTGMSGMVDGDFRVLDGVMTVKDLRYTDPTAFKTAVTGQTVCYKLATPTTLQLTPAQLELLKGYNRVSIESGTITLDYIAKAISGNDEEIAPLVGDKATKSYAVNDFIERADGLYRVTASIASGASFTANNTVKMSIGEALTYLYNK